MSFKNFKNSLCFDIYVNEVWLITSCLTSLENKLLATSIVIKSHSNPKNNILDSCTEPHEIISTILNHIARLNKLFHAVQQRDGEDREDYNLRQDRCRALKKLLFTRTKPTEILKSKVRNSVDHFDERLDIISRKVMNGDEEINRKTIIHNLTISKKETFVNWEDLLPVKVFVVDEMKYYIIGSDLDAQEVNLKKIFSEVRAINEECLKYVKTRSGDSSKLTGKPTALIKTPPHTI